MPSELLLLVGREAPDARDVFESYAEKVLQRGTVDAVRVDTYERELGRELRSGFADIDHDRVYALPMSASHTYDTAEELPAALSTVPGDVYCCELLGQQPAVTDVVLDRATAELEADVDASVVLVGFGSSSRPTRQRATEFHADRLRDRSVYGDVTTCYLMQNPAVECARYNVSTDRAVAVPMFLTHNEATDRQIPDRLELDRGGIEYADPMGVHDRIVDAIAEEVRRQRRLASGDTCRDPTLDSDHQPLAADGEGPAQ